MKMDEFEAATQIEQWLTTSGMDAMQRLRLRVGLLIVSTQAVAAGVEADAAAAMTRECVGLAVLARSMVNAQGGEA